MGRPKQLWALAKESEVDVSAWLIETMMDLSHNGHLDEALTLRKDLGMLLESIDRVVYCPLLLAIARRHEEAIAEARAIWRGIPKTLRLPTTLQPFCLPAPNSLRLRDCLATS